MKKVLVVLFILSGVTNLYSQSITVDTTGVYKINAQYQVPPKFQGDIDKWIANNIVSNGQEEGEAYVSFVIQTDGRITDVKVMRTLPPMYNNLGAAALKIMYTLPKWNPAMQNGKPVEVTYSLGFVFGH